MLKQGLYEQLINEDLRKQLEETEKIQYQIGPVHEHESKKILSRYLAEVMEHVLEQEPKVEKQIQLVNTMIETLKGEVDNPALQQLKVESKLEQLLSLDKVVEGKRVQTEKNGPIRPETSISRSSLFTGASHEPQMFSELKKEIRSSNRIDMLVSFIKWSGLRLIMNELKEYTQNGGKLRIITTSYMGATDLKAIEVLSELSNTEIKISYDTNRTRLHAKTYVFYRDTGFTTAYVGSSNLSSVAMSSGLEWNIKVTHKDLPETLEKIEATFESYWNADEFEHYDQQQKQRLAAALRKEGIGDFNTGFVAFDLIPYSYQQEILDQLDAERKIRGHFRNLVIAATGTGKTVISAFDYRNFKRDHPTSGSRLLFVAHREEILKQSLFTFRNILRDQNFGDLFVGSYQPDQIDHLFVSIQTLNSQDLPSITTPDYYDYIIVDEFHHAAAPSYQRLLHYYQPKVLLGLTATPERMDGKNVLEYFDQRIAAEIRLPEAIERKLLCPFQYFGVTDTVDLNTLKWVRGGYDKGELTTLYASDSSVAIRRAQGVVDAVHKYVTDIDEVKGLGFCVSVEHAGFMSAFFNAQGISSMSLTSQSTSEERTLAKNMLVSGKIRFIFVVDLYNEGVDIPEINTVLFLRPTESLTVFLQQLGRGLRLAPDKECLTILDFIGQANKKYNFEDKFAALLMDNTRSVQRELKEEFMNVPKGCYIQLERKAQKYILDNIRANVSGKLGLISRIATFEEDTGLPLSLQNFLEHYHLDIRTIYAKDTFSNLCVSAKVKKAYDEELEEVMSKAFQRFCFVDSRRFIKFILGLLENNRTMFDPTEQRMLQMLHFTIWQKPYEECGFHSLLEGVHKLKECPILCEELIEILMYKFNKIDFVDEVIDLGFESPLDLHCTYTRDQILVGADFLKPATVREGVKYLPDKNIDILFVTLNKTEKDYSSTTMYEDYSINDHLFHWQSQSTTSQSSVTGQRYIHHLKMNHKILLFVREFKKDHILGNGAAYTYLGSATYQSHEGSNPMSIVWKMDHPIPAKFLKKTNKLVIG